MRQWIVDAFASGPFTGNPAAVVEPFAAWPGDDWLLALAQQNNLSETAYLRPTADPARFGLRWFTPGTEVALCGHATLATAFVLFEELGHPGPVLTFDTLSGPLTVAKGEGGRLVLDFPATVPVPVAAEAVAAACGVTSEATLHGGEDVILVLADEAAVRAVTPDFVALKALGAGGAMRGIIVTAPGAAGSGVDFVSRFFGPAVGIDEDPVTGSAHTVLMPYWAGRLGRTELVARQVSARGGTLWLTLAGDRVRMAGHGHLFSRAEVLVPAPH